MQGQYKSCSHNILPLWIWIKAVFTCLSHLIQADIFNANAQPKFNSSPQHMHHWQSTVAELPMMHVSMSCQYHKT